MSLTAPESGPTPAFVNVPVPAEHVIDVMRYLTTLQSTNVAALPEEPDVDDWSDEQLARIPTSEQKTFRILTDLLDVMSAEPDKWMNLDDLAERTDWDRVTLANVGTHITRALKARFDGADWPFETAWGPRIALNWPAVQYYRVGSERAEQWKRVRNNAA